MSANVWDQRSFKVLLVLVLLLAAPTLWSWFSPTTSVNQYTSLNTSAGRDPASITTMATPNSTKLSHPVTVEWDLSGQDFKKEILGTHLRLKGFLKGLKAEEIKNESNGFTASVFVTGPGFTTDYIELKDGKNQIHVELVDPAGKKITRKIEVVRRAPAAQ